MSSLYLIVGGTPMRSRDASDEPRHEPEIAMVQLPMEATLGENTACDKAIRTTHP